jgi:hypothetical protein
VALGGGELLRGKAPDWHVTPLGLEQASVTWLAGGLLQPVKLTLEA